MSKYIGADDRKTCLYHYKYLRKEKIGDKWRYYYEEDDKKPESKGGSKEHVTRSMNGVPVGESYYVTNSTTNYERKEVSKEEYENAELDNAYFVGDKKLAEIQAENLNNAIDFVKSLVTGKLASKKDIQKHRAKERREQANKNRDSKR